MIYVTSMISVSVSIRPTVAIGGQCRACSRYSYSMLPWQQPGRWHVKVVADLLIRVWEDHVAATFGIVWLSERFSDGMCMCCMNMLHDGAKRACWIKDDATVFLCRPQHNKKIFKN